MKAKPKSNFQIACGALSPRLKEQFEKAGIRAKAKDVRRWQYIADAITACYLHHVITDSATNSAREKLVKRIGRELSSGQK